MQVLVFGGIAGMFVMLAGHYWDSLFEKETLTTPRSFRLWVAQGVGFPILLWILANLGLSRFFPPLLPDLAAVSVGGFRWFALVCSEVSPGFALIGSLWTGVTLGWLAALIGIHADDRREFFVTIAVCSVISLPAAWLILYLGGLVSLGLAAIVFFGMGVHFTLDLLPAKRARRSYSRAIAKLKFGKYADAEWEVIRELENQEDDYEGWMLLAELYATRFHDLAGATQVISDLVSQPNLTAIQISIAMHRLADWHLKYEQDPHAARTILEELCRRVPGGHVERMSRVRIDGLPATKDDLIQRQASKPIRLPALSESFEAQSQTGPALDTQEAAALANKCVERLTRDPNDVSAREEFARTIAEGLGKIDPAVEQIKMLMAMPGQPESKQAEWLSLLASWELRYRTDRGLAMVYLRRLVREFRDTPQAFAAQRRLSLLEMDARVERARAKAETEDPARKE